MIVMRRTIITKHSLCLLGKVPTRNYVYVHRYLGKVQLQESTNCDNGTKKSSSRLSSTSDYYFVYRKSTLDRFCLVIVIRGICPLPPGHYHHCLKDADSFFVHHLEYRILYVSSSSKQTYRAVPFCVCWEF